MQNQFWKKYIGLFILAWGGTFVYRVPYMRYLMYEPLQKALAVNDTEFGTMMSVYGVTAMLTYWPGGWLADRVKPRYLLCFSYIVTGILGIYFATFPSYAACVAIHGAWGVSTTLTFWAAMLRATKDMAPQEELGKFYGLLESGRGLLTAGSVAICIWIYSRFVNPTEGMSFILNIMNAACLLGAVLTWFCFKDPAELVPNPSLGKDILLVLRSPWIWCVAMIVFCCYCALVLGGYLTPYMTRVIGIDAATIGYLSTFWIYGSQFLAAPIAGTVADKLGSRPVVLVVLFSFLTLIFIVLRLAPSTTSMFVLLVIISASIYCGIYAIRGVYFAVLDDLRVPSSVVGAAIGFASLVGFAPDAFLYTVAGMMLDNHPGAEGFHILFVMAGIMAALGVVISIAVMGKAKAIKRAEA